MSAVATSTTSAPMEEFQPLQPLSPQLRFAVEAFASSHKLTRRELDILELVVRGAISSAEIAARLGVSPNTVHNHCKNIFRRTRTNSKASVLSRLVHFVASADLPSA